MSTFTRTQRVAALRALIALAALVTSPPASAAVAPLDAILPDSLPLPAQGLAVWWPGGTRGYAPAGTTWTASEAAQITSQIDSRGRIATRFSGQNPASPARLLIGLPKALLPAKPTDALSAAGATVALWYRAEAAHKIAGWNPLVAIGDTAGGETWRWAIVLQDGVPVLARRTGSELVVIKAFSVIKKGNVADKGQVDDGVPHHIAVRLSRPGCAVAACPQPDAALVSLYVDGVLRGESLSPLAADSTRVAIGRLPVTGAGFAGQKNWHAATGSLLTAGILQDVGVWRAPLSLGELAAARAAGAGGMVAMFPPLDAAALDLAGDKVQVSPGLPPSDLTALKFTSATPVSLGSLGSQLALPGASAANNLELSHTARTVALWLRLPDPTSSGELVRLQDASGRSLSVAIQGGQLSASCGSGGSAVVGGLGAGNGSPASWAANSWHLLVLQTDAANGFRLSADLAVIGSGSCSGGVPKGGGFDVLLSRPSTAPLAWGAVWAQPLNAAAYLPLGTVAELGAPGPAAWLEGAQNVSPFTQVVPANASLVFDASAAGQREVAIPTQKHALGGKTDASGPWTAVLRLRIDALPPGGFATSVLRRSGPAGGYESDVQLWCGPNDCAVCLHGPAAKQAWCFGALKKGVDHRLAFTSPMERKIVPAPDQPNGPVGNGASETVLEPLVVLDGSLLNRRYTSDPQKLTPQLNSVGAPLSAGGAWRLGLVDNGTLAGFKLRVHELRLYPYAVRDASRVAGKCAALACETDGGRTCQEAQGKLSAQCSSCAAGWYKVAGAAETECAARRGFYSECRDNAMCASGKCDAASRVCLAATPQECATECAKIGRSCGAGGATCGACLGQFKAPAGTSTVAGPGYQCGWAPTKKGWELCSSDAECISGACRDVSFEVGPRMSNPQWPDKIFTDSDNSGCTGTCTKKGKGNGKATVNWPTVSQKRCLMRPDLGESCASKLHTSVAQVEQVKRPDGSQGEAQKCALGTWAQCQPYFKSQFPVLHGYACGVAIGVPQHERIGRCHHEYCWSCAKCKQTEDISVVDTKAAESLWKTNPANFSLIDLKRIFLGTKDEPYNKNVDYQKLRDIGVGPLLIAYAAASTADKAKLAAKHGAFLPVGGCAGNWIAANNAYASSANWPVCAPKLQEDGGLCPPAGVKDAESIDKNSWCKSQYCGRDDGTCKRGDNPMQEVRGQAGNKNKSGKSAVKFGVVKVDDTVVEMKDGKPAVNTNDYRYEATVDQGYVSCVLGAPFPKAPLFKTSIHVDRSSGPDCAENEFKTFILGFQLTGPAPSAPGSCTLVSASSSSSGFKTCGGKPKPGCTAIQAKQLSVSSLASLAVPKLKFCAPIGGGGQEGGGAGGGKKGFELPEIKKDFKEALVPLIVSIGLTLDLCIEGQVGMDDKGLPQMGVTPLVGVGVVARGGVGVGETGVYEFSAGVRLALTLVQLSFPITWGIDVSDALNAQGKVVLGMLKLEVIQKISMVLEYLSGAFGLYAEFSIGPFGYEWTLNLFDWTGIKAEFELASIPLFSTILDFQAQFLQALQGAAKPQCDAGPSSPCYQ